MPMKALGVAAVALACSTNIAAAQQAAATPEEVAALLHQGVAMGGGRLSTGAAANAANLSTGWNFQHCWTAQWYTNGSSAYVFAYNLEGTYFYAPNGPGGGYAGAANTLLQVCDTGQLYGVYVTDPSTLAFSWIQTKE